MILVVSTGVNGRRRRSVQHHRFYQFIFNVVISAINVVSKNHETFIYPTLCLLFYC